jgi:thiamine biosynthesis protein ThiS
MNITLNGEKREVPDGVTVLDLLEFLKIKHGRVAVERNEQIVKKDVYGTTDIQEGDSLEVVSFMAGGSYFGLRNADCGIKKKTE